MSVGTTAAGSAEAIARLASAKAPILVFEVDADRSRSGRHSDVRLVGVLPVDAANGHAADEDGVAAVLLLHARTPSTLLSCVRAATSGTGQRPRSVTDLVTPELAGTEPALTHREFDVLRLLADGGTTREIAQRLSYSERTIKSIVRSLLDKLNCRTRAHAVALAARQGVV